MKKNFLKTVTQINNAILVIPYLFVNFYQQNYVVYNEKF